MKRAKCTESIIEIEVIMSSMVAYLGDAPNDCVY